LDGIHKIATKETLKVFCVFTLLKMFFHVAVYKTLVVLGGSKSKVVLI
jgi:hypothetical protein